MTFMRATWKVRVSEREGGYVVRLFCTKEAAQAFVEQALDEFDKYEYVGPVEPN